VDLARAFLAGSLTAAGGVVEETPEGLAALLPEAEARRLGLPEELAIALAAAPAPGSRGVDGRLGSPLLERLVAESLARPAFAAVALPSQLPRALPEGQPVLLNAVRHGRVSSGRAVARFLAAEVRLTLQGEDLRSALASVTVRVGDGALVPDLDLAGAYPVGAPPFDEAERRAVRNGLRVWLRREAPRRLAGALDTLRRRARRDLERIADYYASLDAEMARAAERARSEDERARRVAKRAALAAELAGRRAQARDRMRARLAGRLVAASLVEAVVERFTVPVRRRSRPGEVAVLARPDGVLEGPRCAACAAATLRVFLCDERLHVLCDRCGHAGRLDATRCPACTHAGPTPLAITVDDPTACLRLGG
jgi:plasmid stabilization system protein ParE